MELQKMVMKMASQFLKTAYFSKISQNKLESRGAFAKSQMFNRLC